MSRMKSLALMYAMAAMTMDGIGTDNGDTRPEKITGKLPEKPLPKGCKEYFFNINGGFSTEKMRRGEVVFKCVALNDKNAKRKFQTWYNKEQNVQVCDATKDDSSN